MENESEFLKKLVNDAEVKILLNSIYDGVYITNTDRQILFWNEAAENITGYARNEVMNRHCSDNILNHIDENGVQLCFNKCPLSECMRHDKSTEAKVFPMHKDKTRFPVITRVGPIKDHNGKIVGAIEVFRDVTKSEELRILQEKFNKLIKKYVSSSTYNDIVSRAETGQESHAVMRDMTILYVDVVDFSGFAENNELHEIESMLNDVFGICEVITKEFQGDIDKFIGDAIMATFIDANDAVNAAEKILHELKEFNMVRSKNEKMPIGLHIGINSGNVIHAEVGTSERKDLTVLGDAVNIAARIEEISEPNSIFISESTFSRIKNSQKFTFYKKVDVKGRKEPVNVYKSEA